MTHGSLFSGYLDGFATGFQWAGIPTIWQCELRADARACLADRFPSSKQFSDVRHCGARNLSPVEILSFTSPCQGNSTMASHSRKGLADERSGLFFDAIRILGEIRPQWVVFENVPGLLNVNEGKDFWTVLNAFRDSGYVGFYRVLDARYFGVAQGRRRLFVVAGLGRRPHMDFLADALPVEGLPRTFDAEQERAGDSWAAYTLTAPGHDNRENSRLNLGSENLVAHADAWHQMLNRARATETHGFCRGLSPCDLVEAGAAGNAVCPQIAQWIATILQRS